MLNPIFQRFSEKSPVSVIARGMLERAFNSDKLEQWFQKTAIRQYSNELPFSVVFGLLRQVVFTQKPTIHAAFQSSIEEIPVSIQSVYNKLNCIEITTSAELLRYSAQETLPILEKFGIQQNPWLPGFQIKIVDGNCIKATHHRLKELRPLAAGALPGKSLVVYDPQLDLVIDVFPCEDGHAQERSLLHDILPIVQPNDLWIEDRNFCVLSFLFGIHKKKAFFNVRQHQNLPFKETSKMKYVGKSETGKVYEQEIEITNEVSEKLQLRRIKVCLNEATKDGETEIYILTNLEKKVANAIKIAELYRKRWTIETAFQKLERDFNSEINTLGYPKAALFGFCLALVSYNIMSVIKGALRKVHGVEKVEKEVSEYYIGLEIGETYQGMRIAIDEEEWEFFTRLSIDETSDFFIELAKNVKLATFKKHRRGPKKKRPKKHYDPKQPHVSTDKLIKSRVKK